VVVEVRDASELSLRLVVPWVEYLPLLLLNEVVGAGEELYEQQCFLVKLTGLGRLEKVNRLFSSNKSNFEGRNFPLVTVVMKGGLANFSLSLDCCILRHCCISCCWVLLTLNVAVVVLFAAQS
jgi:hypothetical protein